MGSVWGLLNSEKNCPVLLTALISAINECLLPFYLLLQSRDRTTLYINSPAVFLTMQPESMCFSDRKSHHIYVEDIVCGLFVSEMCMTVGNSRNSEPQSQADEWKIWESSQMRVTNPSQPIIWEAKY